MKGRHKNDKIGNRNNEYRGLTVVKLVNNDVIRAWRSNQRRHICSREKIDIPNKASLSPDLGKNENYLFIALIFSYLSPLFHLIAFRLLHYSFTYAKVDENYWEKLRCKHHDILT